jgi:hypothetical protein
MSAPDCALQCRPKILLAFPRGVHRCPYALFSAPKTLRRKAALTECSLARRTPQAFVRERAEGSRIVRLARRDNETKRHFGTPELARNRFVDNGLIVAD